MLAIGSQVYMHVSWDQQRQISTLSMSIQDLIVYHNFMLRRRNRGGGGGRNVSLVQSPSELMLSPSVHVTSSEIEKFRFFLLSLHGQTSPAKPALTKEPLKLKFTKRNSKILCPWRNLHGRTFSPSVSYIPDFFTWGRNTTADRKANR